MALRLNCTPALKGRSTPHYISMKSLLLTLGHNSSAILIKDGQVIWGYETERLSGVKSDSHFPQMVLDAKNLHKPDMVYATHWAPTGKLSDMSRKHWKPEAFDGVPIRSLAIDRTHHDTHMAAAISYAGKEFSTRRDVYGIVIDGFGTLGEHFSIYELKHGVPHLIRRVHGYETSLGLWYQYATAFMGMKMHEDEYKLLGYQVHCPMDIWQRVTDLADNHANQWMMKMDKSIYGSKYDPMYDIDALANIKEMHFQHLADVCKRFDIRDPSSADGRAILAHYVQRVLESVVTGMIAMTCGSRAQHLLCSGGVFFNVKLNKRLIDIVQGQLCVFPLAGDQGNAIGLYAMDNPSFQFPPGLNWGARRLRNVGKVEGLSWMSEADAKEYVTAVLKLKGYINVVRGNMEFGPRALCNTTTLAVPTATNVAKINAANNRNTVMPMAPVMTGMMYHTLFRDTSKVWRSEEHMIVAMQYKDKPTHMLQGIAHRYATPSGKEYYTGRPQVIDRRDFFMTDILGQFGHPLINTSFNFHGQPIAYESEHVIKNHMLQYARDSSFETVIIPN